MEIARCDHLLGVLILKRSSLHVGLLAPIVGVVVDILEARRLWVAVVVDQRLLDSCWSCPIVEYIQQLTFVFAFASHLILIHIEPAIHDLVFVSTLQALFDILAAKILDKAGHQTFLAEA